MQKPGYKTTEAWISLLSSLLLVAVSYGLLTQAQADDLVGLVAPALPLLLSPAEIAAALGALAAALFPA